jgi:hypothetical protein
MVTVEAKPRRIEEQREIPIWGRNPVIAQQAADATTVQKGNSRR